MATGRFGKKFRIISAIEKEDIRLLLLLMQKQNHRPEAPIDKLGSNIFHLACYLGKMTMINYIYDNFHLDINLHNEDGEAPIHMAVSGGHINVVKWLWEKGADVHVPTLYYHKTPYDYCCNMIKTKKFPDIGGNPRQCLAKIVEIKNYLLEKYFTDKRGEERRKFIWAQQKLKEKGKPFGRLTKGMAREIAEFL
ncbi:unnamed protein product [Blepharisma stoltei]|uniref:Uncharacterized protein n=1 Tax=Blepharisma stoltei TaxID=1481888 RepID=A0AAU9ID64_9CILI|nr:unnamed protein product [Blepharisma stoltei]